VSLILTLLEKKNWEVPAHSAEEKHLLHIACQEGFTSIVSLLLSKLTPNSPSILRNYHIDDVDEDGMSSLMIAAREGYAEIVAELLAHGADWRLENRNGYNAYWISIAHSKPNVTKIFRSKQVLLSLHVSLLTVISMTSTQRISLGAIY
jgi:ankyrin repeat protein